MSRSMLALAAALVLVPLAAGQEVTGSGKSTTVKRELATFTSVEIRTGGKLTISVGKSAPLEITGDDNIAPIIKTEVTNGKLMITCEQSYTTKTDLEFVVNVAELKSLDVYSAASATVAGITGESFATEIHGSGKVTLAGKTENLDARIKGSGKIDALKLASRNASVTITGSGSAQLDASESLKVSITGRGKVEYTGSPKVTKSITGIGEVQQIKSDKKD